MTTRFFLIGTAFLTFVFSNVAKGDSGFESEEAYLNQLNSGDLIQTRLVNPLSNERDRKLSRSLELTRDYHYEISNYLAVGDTFFDQFTTREEIKKWTSIFNEIKELEKEGIRFYRKEIDNEGIHLISESAQGHDVMGSCVFGLPGVETEFKGRPACLGYVKLGDETRRYYITFAHWSGYELKSKTKDSSVFPTDLLVFKGKLKQIVSKPHEWKSDISIIYVDNSNDKMRRLNDYLVHKRFDTEDLRKYQIDLRTTDDGKAWPAYKYMARPVKK